MNMQTTARLPNLFDLILTEPRSFSLPAFALTYVLLPFMITIALITTGIVLPNGTVAAEFLFLAVLYSNALIAAALAYALPKAESKKRSSVHLFVSSLFPFLLWRVSVMILFGY